MKHYYLGFAFVYGKVLMLLLSHPARVCPLVSLATPSPSSPTLINADHRTMTTHSLKYLFARVPTGWKTVARTGSSEASRKTPARRR
ncbi:hypothetical protein C0Q70_00758 [Pomacea canaliculata]|uniref:Secreted protein n=1 Tax=Pomacea canaliculata TaxID=400727 RepID=A0A2T7PXN4_POMCA|nr:hypothetical protein C0Q70_00758 [Pomacea canaliculata]